MRRPVSQNLTDLIRELIGQCDGDPRSDADLLTAFADTGDEGAFVALVARHGRAVWAACRRALPIDRTDAEDAFQATFIALARKAGRLRRESVGGWLEHVAGQAAADIRRRNRRRAAAHCRLCERAVDDTMPTPPDTEMTAVVHEELAKLPEWLRLPLTLHFLEGKTQAEVGLQLGITRQAVAARLERGLEALRQQLERRGLAVSVAVLVATLGTVSTASAAVPAGLVAAAVRAGLSAGRGTVVAGRAADVAAALGASKWSVPAMLAFGATAVVVGAVALAAVAGGSQTPPAIDSRLESPSAVGRITEPVPAVKPDAEVKPGPRTAVVSGQALDAGGKPIPHSTVTILARRPSLPGREALRDEVLVTGQANADGRYRLTVPADFPTWSAERTVRVLVSSTGTTPGTVATTIRAGENATADVRLGAVVPFRGEVRRSDGKPAAGVRVTVIRLGAVTRDDPGNDTPTGWPPSVMTDAAGWFVLTGVDPVSGVWVRFDGEGLGASAVRLPEKALPDGRLPTWTLTAGRTLTGRAVAGDTGKAIPNARVAICTQFTSDVSFTGQEAGALGSAPATTETTTDQDGRFRLTALQEWGLRDLLVVVVPPPGSRYLGLSRRVRPDDPPEVPIPQLPRGVIVRGRVVDADTGAGVAGAAVTTGILPDNAEGHDLQRQLAPRAGLLRDIAHTDADGRFALVSLPGAGFVVANGPTDDFVPHVFRINTGTGLREYAHGSEPVVAAPPGQDLPEVRVTIQRGTTITAQVEGADRGPAGKGVMLLAAGRTEFVQAGRAKPRPIVDGRLELPGCQPGTTYPVVVLDPDRRQGAVVDLSVGSSSPPVVRLQLCGAARVRIVTPTGEPVPGVAISPRLFLDHSFPTGLLEPTGRLADRHTPTGADGRLVAPSRTDADGWAQVEGLVPGARYVLTCTTGETAPFTVPAAETVRLPMIVVPTKKRSDSRSVSFSDASSPSSGSVIRGDSIDSPLTPPTRVHPD